MVKGMISFKHKGRFGKTFQWLKSFSKINYDVLEKYGDEGLAALREATPKDTGLTADSWYYRVVRDDVEKTVSIRFFNSNVHNGIPIAIILQYGHATGTGGWVEGRDYINPAIQPIFDRILKDIWREVENG